MHFQFQVVAAGSEISLIAGVAELSPLSQASGCRS